MHGIKNNESSKKPNVHRSFDSMKCRGKGIKIIRSSDSESIRLNIPGDIEPLRRGNINK